MQWTDFITHGPMYTTDLCTDSLFGASDAKFYLRFLTKRVL